MKERMIKKVIKKMATSLVTNVPYEWPPGCLFMIYQPVRPEQKMCSPRIQEHAKRKKNSNAETTFLQDLP